MQLQMTAPLDIGLEQHDAALGIGQEDVFDLGDAEKRMSQDTQVQWLNDEALEAIDDEGGKDEVSSRSEEDEDEVLSSAEERDKRVGGLEAELDGLYEAYKDRLRERDAKFKAKEERSKNKEREKEWNGIQIERDSDGESTDSDGGWDVAQRNKLGDNDASSDESSDEGEEGDGGSTKYRKRTRSSKDTVAPAAKRQRLLNNLESPSKPSTAAARLWFSQDVFSGLDRIDDLEDDESREDHSEEEDEVMSEGVSDEEDEEASQVRC